MIEIALILIVLLMFIYEAYQTHKADKVMKEAQKKSAGWYKITTHGKKK